MPVYSKEAWLSAFLKLLSIGYLTVFSAWITLIIVKAPMLAPGGGLAPMVRFQPYNAPYESMLAAIHLVWGVMLWRASGDPQEHLLFIDFTIWANVAHGIVMLVVTPLQKGLTMTIIEGFPMLVIAAVLLILRPRAADAGAARA